MTLTAPEVAALSASLSAWEFGEYVCAAIVTLACFGEFVSEFTNWFTGGFKERKERLAKRSTLLLTVALSLELVCLVKTNQISGMVIGSISTQARDASDNARKALADSNSAIAKSGLAATSAKGATTAAAKAVDESKKAEGAASGALSLARGTQKEADSFERAIKSANDELSKLRNRMADRDLTAEDRSKISHILDAYRRGDEDVHVDSLLSEGREALRYANEIAILFRTTWPTIPRPEGFETVNVPLTGILVEYGSSPSAVAATRVIRDAFGAAGIRVSENVSDNSGKKRVLVLIGSK